MKIWKLSNFYLKNTKKLSKFPKNTFNTWKRKKKFKGIFLEVKKICGLTINFLRIIPQR